MPSAEQINQLVFETSEVALGSYKRGFIEGLKVGTDKLPQWIDIDIERPEFGRGVILHLHSGFRTIGYRKRIEAEVWWQLFGDTEFLIPKGDYVTHWMPLPEPPL